MARHSQDRWHDNGALVWTWRLTLIVSAGALVLIGAAAAMWASGSRIAAHAPLTVAVAVVALFVAVSGRLATAAALRYRDIDLPQPRASTPSVPGSTRRSRRVVRRRNGVPYLVMCLAGGLAAAAVVNWPTQPYTVSVAEVVLAAGGAAGCYLAGPAARFVVTPRHLCIDTALHRITVPRHLIGRFTRHGLDVRLDLTDGEHLYFRVDSPLLDVASGSQYRTNGRAQLRTVTKIVTALDRVPAASQGGGQATTRRTGMIAFAASVAFVSAVAFTVMTVTAFG